MGVEYRFSRVGVISRHTAISWRVLSGSLSAWRIAVRVRKTRGLGRHRRCGLGASCGWRDAYGFDEAAFAYLEHDRTHRHHFCCLQRASVRLERLAVDARAAGTSAESSPDISGAADYRITPFDFRPAGTSAN